jgi:hypothetical protein
MFCAHKILFLISIGIYIVGHEWLIESSFIKFICSLSTYFKDAIYCNPCNEVLDYKVWSLWFICCIIDLSMSVSTY